MPGLAVRAGKRLVLLLNISGAGPNYQFLAIPAPRSSRLFLILTSEELDLVIVVIFSQRS